MLPPPKGALRQPTVLGPGAEGLVQARCFYQGMSQLRLRNHAGLERAYREGICFEEQLFSAPK